MSTQTVTRNQGELMTLERNLWNENTQARISPAAPEIGRDVDNPEEVMVVECACGHLRFNQFSPCGKCSTYGVHAFRATDEAWKFINSDELTQNSHWYHATLRKNWGETIEGSMMSVHLGTKDSALALMKGRASRGLQYFPGQSLKFDLYRISLAPQAILSPVVCPDLVNQWANYTDDLFSLTGAHFVRYLNTYENAGSISLIGDSAQMVIEEKTSMSFDTNGDFHFEEAFAF